MALFDYNKRNLLEAKRMRGNVKKRYLAELEHSRIYKFKLQPKKAKRLKINNPSYGKWIKRKKPLRKIKLSL